ncbi:MAG: site-2 protease family protein [Planctomycetes bacterium]|nr:site-2 protease family protein [Planctomycetota bacterium]
MGMYLIALDSWITNGWNWLLMGFSIGLIIFVHELGHFLVAKACGVKCEKFYLGFDVFGLKIVHFQWGETEYGIGALPLGGYVKMLGQDDNPANAAEEAERTKLNKAQSDATEEAAEKPASADAQSSLADSGSGASTAGESDTTSDDTTSDAVTSDDELNPRSYTAKTVPQRMAIISAGVIMNIIFAFVFATIAYGVFGVSYIPCHVSGLAPGGEAWVKDVRAGGDIRQYGELDDPSTMEMRRNTVLTDTENGVPVIIYYTDRQGEVGSPVEMRLYPAVYGDLPQIGLRMGSSTTVFDVLEGSPAELASVKFKKGDKIISVNGETVLDYGHLHESLARDPTKPVTIVVERSKEDDSDRSEEVTIVVGPRPMRRLGFVMEMGKIVAVQVGSPAALAIQQGTPDAEQGLKAGDFIEKIKFDVLPGEQLDDMNNVDTGGPPGDPMTLPERLRRKGAGKSADDRVIFLTVKRDGETLNFRAQLRPTTGYQSAYLPSHPVSETSLGIAYRVVNRVAGVIDGRDSELQKGDVLVEVKFVPADKDQHDDEKKRGSLRPYKFAQSEEDLSDPKKIGWPVFTQRLQAALADTTVELTFNRKVGDKTESHTVTISPYESDQWFVPERGLLMEPIELPREVSSLSDAMAYGFAETIDALTMVYRTLKKLFSGGLSPTHLGGMGTIFAIAGTHADRGMADLLLFMTLISANLAVINFLPIPVLDGGHMVILAAEAIRRKPVSERILIPVTYAGLIFILGLFLFVTVLDVGRGWEWLQEALS